MYSSSQQEQPSGLHRQIRVRRLHACRRSAACRSKWQVSKSAGVKHQFRGGVCSHFGDLNFVFRGVLVVSFSFTLVCVRLLFMENPNSESSLDCSAEFWSDNPLAPGAGTGATSSWVATTPILVLCTQRGRT